jgi:hypothetical protein
MLVFDLILANDYRVKEMIDVRRILRRTPEQWH